MSSESKVGKPMFYYGNVEYCDQLIPIVTVASTWNPEDGTVNRGVAICSVHDCPSKAEGRKLALKRLRIAHNRKQSCLPINWNTENIIMSGAGETEFRNWEFKVQYHVQPEPIELRVFKKQ
jgi:hypothetical protein